MALIPFQGVVLVQEIFFSLLFLYYNSLLFPQHSHGRSRPTKRSGTRGNGTTSECTPQTKKKASTLRKGRYGSNLLYSSSEDDDVESSATTLPLSLSTLRPSSVQASFCHSRSPSIDGSDNPFENFTVGKSGSSAMTQSIRISEASGQRSKTRLPLSSTVAISGSNSRFNPLGQVEGCVMTALIPENGEERGSGGQRLGDNERDFPIIDDWLVDDMSANEQNPASKRKKYLSLSSGAVSGREVRSFLEGTTSNASGGGRRKRPLQRKTNTAPEEGRSVVTETSGGSTYPKGVSDEGTSKKRKTETSNVIDVSSSDSDERFLDSVIITEEDLMDFDTTPLSSHDHQQLPRRSPNDRSTTPTSGFLERTSTQRPKQYLPASSHQSLPMAPNGHLTNNRPHHRRSGPSDKSLGYHSQTTTVTPTNMIVPTTAPRSTCTNSVPSSRALFSDSPPLRVKVKIESRSYLVPCPRRDESGLDTTVGWLIKQASERHYAQQGVRPRLSLTTLDGAILCPLDPLVHVVSPNEEVVGVVEEWLEATLEESYQVACKRAGVGKLNKFEYLFRYQVLFSSGIITLGNRIVYTLHYVRVAWDTHIHIHTHTHTLSLSLSHTHTHTNIHTHTHTHQFCRATSQGTAVF